METLPLDIRRHIFSYLSIFDQFKSSAMTVSEVKRILFQLYLNYRLEAEMSFRYMKVFSSILREECILDISKVYDKEELIMVSIGKMERDPQEIDFSDFNKLKPEQSIKIFYDGLVLCGDETRVLPRYYNDNDLFRIY